MAKKYRVPPNRKLYIALRHTRESRRCVNRKKSEEENTRHHQPASSCLRNSQANFPVPRKHSTADSKGTLVSGCGPLVLSPSRLLTGTARCSEDTMECTTYFVFSWATYFSFKTTVVFQLFPCEGISFPWTRVQDFLSAACVPLHHPSLPRRPQLWICSRKWLPCSLGDKRTFGPEHSLSSTKRRAEKHPHQHQ